MTNDRPHLLPDFGLTQSGRRAFVVREADGVRVAQLSAVEAVALGLMTGARPAHEIDALVEGLAGPIGLRILRRMEARLAPLLARDAPAQVLPEVDLEALADVRLDRPSLCRDVPGPKVLHWWVTNACPRRCVYCFANPDHAGTAADATLPRARLAELFAEAAALGATTLLVAGGEPFLRADLPEVMGDAVAAGLDPLVTTKAPITPGLAARIAMAGVRHICLSVDAFDPEVNRALIGSASLGAQTLASAKALRCAGVAFSIEFVATALNHHCLEDAAARAATLGAQVLLVVPFEPVMHPIGRLTNAQMRAPASARLEERIDRLDGVDGLRVERFREIGEIPGAPQCDIGKTKLFFDPAGRVHRCYKLLHDHSLFGPSLIGRKIAEVWHGDALADLVRPEPADYAEAACGACGRLGACNADGRCIFEAKLKRGRYAERDRDCVGPYPVAEPST